jgi:hypothetical protein
MAHVTVHHHVVVVDVIDDLMIWISIDDPATSGRQHHSQRPPFQAMLTLAAAPATLRPCRARRSSSRSAARAAPLASAHASAADSAVSAAQASAAASRRNLLLGAARVCVCLTCARDGR